MKTTARLFWFAFAVVVALTCAHFSPTQAQGLFQRKDAMPSLAAGTGWVNSAPITTESLRGKVVLVDFWTYSCINCLRTLPYVKAWAQKYKDAGLAVVGVHTPEFGFEMRGPNVQRAVKDLAVDFPVVTDSKRALWQAFGVQGWPTMMLVDAQGKIRLRQLGEGGYEDTERAIQQLLRDAGAAPVPTGFVAPQGEGTQAAPGRQRTASNETYLGAAQRQGFRVTPAAKLSLNEWTLDGAWTVEDERVCLRQGTGRIAYRFMARDLHLVAGPAMDGETIPFRVRVDGRDPGPDKGFDTDAAGNGRADAHRLFQLVRQGKGSGERLFEIEFAKPGVCAYAFTFG
ncbi:redoxin family protein [Ramlibacter sp. PS4R-6]|uniref:redoxin family protein n=1 Tax=Ramlibacter sp. PS4R-6 TaxID=3133438 RepID=UPI00309FD958